MVQTPHGEYDFRVVETTQPGVECSAQPTLLFLHGFLGSADDFKPCMDALSSEFRCVALDLPGHGATSVTCTTATAGAAQQSPHMSIEATAVAIATAVRALRLDEGKHGCVVVGYSLGARLALRLALVHGDEVAEADAASTSAAGALPCSPYKSTLLPSLLTRRSPAACHVWPPSWP